MTMKAAANNDLQWEVAGGNKRTGVKIDTKKGSKVTVDISKIPRLEQLQPLKMQASQFDAFLEVDADDENNNGLNGVPKLVKKPPREPKVLPPKPPHKKEAQMPSINLVEASVANTQQQKKKPAATPASPKKPAVDELALAISKLQLDVFQKEHTQILNIFPQSPVLVLQHMAALLNKQLSHVPELDASVDTRKIDYPLSQMDTKLEKYLGSAIARTNNDDLMVFGDHLVSVLFEEATKTSHGYKLYMQLVLKWGKRPALFANNLNKYTAELAENKHRHARCLSAFWLLSQVGYAHLASGLQIWLECMLPLAAVPKFSNFVATYPHALFIEHHKVHDAKSPAAVPVSLHQYKLFYDLVNVDKSVIVLHRDAANKMRAAFDVIRKLFAHQLTTPKGSAEFEELLATLPTESSEKQADLVDLTSTCLLSNKDALTKWPHVFAKHIPQSFVLLQFLATSPKSFKRVKHMRETLVKLDEQASHLLAKLAPETGKDVKKENPYARGKASKTATSGTSEVAVLRKFSALIQQLLKEHFKGKSFFSMLFRSLFFVTFVTSVFFYWDANHNKSIYTNVVKSHLDNYGVLEQATQLSKNVEDFRIKAKLAIKQHAPAWYNKVYDTVVPISSSAWNVTCEYAQLALVKAQPAIAIVSDYMNQAQTYINKNLPVLMKNLNWLYEQSVKYSTAFITSAGQYGARLVETIEIQVLGWKKGDLEHVAADAFKSILHSLTTFFQWLNKHLSD